MDLKKVNEEYGKLKARLKEIKEKVEELELEENKLEIEKSRLNTEFLEAKRDKDKAKEERIKKGIKENDEARQKIWGELSKIREEVKKIQDKINDKIKEIRENPEMKAHLEEILRKKYDRKISEYDKKISEFEKDKKEEESKIKRLKTLKQLVIDHPSFANWLKIVISSAAEIEKLNKELVKMKVESQNGEITYKNPDRANDIINNLIPNVENKLNMNKNNLMKYINKKTLDITEQDIDELSKYIKYDKKNGGLILKGTIDKILSCKQFELNSINIKIERYNKIIHDYKNASEKRKDERTGSNGGQNIQLNQQSGERGQNTPQASVVIEEGTQESGESLEKPKWFQFIKRFRNWNERRKQRALPDMNENPNAQPEQPVAPQPEQHVNQQPEQGNNQFRDSMKYDIVKDVIKQMTKEDIEQAIQERNAGEQR